MPATLSGICLSRALENNLPIFCLKVSCYNVIAKFHCTQFNCKGEEEEETDTVTFLFVKISKKDNFIINIILKVHLPQNFVDILLSYLIFFHS